MKALHDLVQSGKVRYIGASSMWTWQLAHYNHVAEKVHCSFTLPIPAC
jgi:aryl-alcohol dehydrogenase-like predicted oxidoreductase